MEIKRTIPKGAVGSKDFKTKKIFVGGIPSSVNEGDFISCSFFLFFFWGGRGVILLHFGFRSQCVFMDISV